MADRYAWTLFAYLVSRIALHVCARGDAELRYWSGAVLAGCVAVGLVAIAALRGKERQTAAHAERCRLAAEAEAERLAAEKAAWASVRPEAYRLDDDHPERIKPVYGGARPKLMVDRTLGVYPEDDE